MLLNLTSFEPESTQYIFADLIALLQHALQQLGHEVLATRATLFTERTNIIIAPHQMDEAVLPYLPAGTVVINTEPLAQYSSGSPQERVLASRVLTLARRFHYWDYSPFNLKFAAQQGIRHGKYLQLGWQPEMQRVRHTAKDIDVLFYGSRNERRVHVLNRIVQHNLTIAAAFNVWGSELDEHIARSKIVLNLHSGDHHPFESLRCFYLMSNGTAIVSEHSDSSPVSAEYRHALITAPYHELAQTCAVMCRNPVLLETVRHLAAQTIRRYPQTKIMNRLMIQTFQAA